MRVTKIEATGLFGIFHHIIQLHENPGITIIHGPNGYGKTVVLKMIDGLFNGRYSILRSVPFQQLDITLDDETVIAVHRQDGEKKNGRNKGHIQISCKKHGNHKFQKFDLPVIEEFEGLPKHSLDDFIPHLQRVGPDEWLDAARGLQLTYQDILEEYSEFLPFRTSSKSAIQPWFAEIQKLIKVHLIGTDRLRSGRSISTRRNPRQGPVDALTVLKYAEDLADVIKSKLAESAALSQSLDRTFPARLVGHKDRIESSDEVRKRLTELELKRSRLKAAGLLDKAEDMSFQIPPETIDTQTLRVLSVYADDVEKKLSIFDAIAAKLELFESLLNTNRFAYKTVSIDKERGFAFTSADNSQLTLTGLSSGEQHELVLLYELLFKVTPNSLILIDEPEISLHVAWQERFLPDLQRITSLSPFDVLIATHSPQIIGNRWDLTVELKGPTTLASETK